MPLMSELGATAVSTAPALPARASRVLSSCCGAHVLHDGFSDLIYVLLPVWQAEFALSLVQVGILKTAYSGAMAVLQVPSSLIAERLGARNMLVFGTALAGCGFLLAGWAGGFIGLLACLALGGAGASVQHPIAAAITARAFEGGRLRAALSTYNFSGDVGKMLLPAATAWLIALWNWRPTTWAIGSLGLAAALAILVALRAMPGGTGAGKSAAPAAVRGALDPAMARRGFLSLASIAVIDSGTRTGFLTFLPFLLALKGASVPTIGMALSLIFAGGATGKFVCGLIAARVGILRTVILTECGTAAGIVLLLVLPLTAALAVLPLVGVALNGTSSVLYGTVAELAPAERRARAFGIFYTVGIGSGAIAPSVFGLFSDYMGVEAILVVVAAFVMLVLPLTLPLRAPLKTLYAGQSS